MHFFRVVLFFLLLICSYLSPRAHAFPIKCDTVFNRAQYPQAYRDRRPSAQWTSLHLEVVGLQKKKILVPRSEIQVDALFDQPHLVWSQDHKNLFILPQPHNGAGSYRYAILNIDGGGVQHKSVSFKPGVISYYRHSVVEPFLHLNHRGDYAIMVQVQQKGPVLGRFREILMAFKADHSFIGVLGFDVPSGLRVSQVYQNQILGEVYDIIFYHKQFHNYFVQSWNFNTKSLIQEKWVSDLGYLQRGHFIKSEFETSEWEPKHYSHLSVDPLKFSHRSPDGRFQIQLAQSPRFGVEEWHLKMTPLGDLSNSKPIVTPYTTPFDFGVLNVFWHKRGEQVLVGTNRGVVWHWNGRSWQAYHGDSFRVEQGILQLFFEGQKLPHQWVDLNKI